MPNRNTSCSTEALSARQSSAAERSPEPGTWLRTHQRILECALVLMRHCKLTSPVRCRPSLTEGRDLWVVAPSKEGSMKIAIAKPCRGLFAVALGIFVAALLFPSDTDAGQVTCHANASGQSHEIEDISVNLPSDWQVLPARSASARAFALLPQGTPYEDAVCTCLLYTSPSPRD